jgi:selenocysteine-specific elongation factor
VRPAAASDPLADHPFVAALESSPFSPPEPAGLDRAVLHELVRRGLVVEREGCYFAPAAVEEAGRVVARLLATSPEGVTVAQVRDALGTTRKHVLPLLGHLDANGVTRRRGDVRVGGPRLPEV